MTAARRLSKELADLMELSNKDKGYFFRNITNPADNMNIWEGVLVCSKEPYHQNKGIKLQIDFPADYPFKPPSIKFHTLLHHPNVKENGEVCLPLILPDNWKPAIKVVKVLEELKKLVENPEIDHALRQDVAEEYSTKKSAFLDQARKTFEKNGVPL